MFCWFLSKVNNLVSFWCLCCILKGFLLWDCVKHWHILQSIMLCACLLGLVCFFIFLLKASKLLAMSKIELKLTLSTKAALLCNITAWINSVCMFCRHLPGFFFYCFYKLVSCQCNNYWAKEIFCIHYCCRETHPQTKSDGKHTRSSKCAQYLRDYIDGDWWQYCCWWRWLWLLWFRFKVKNDVCKVAV